MSETQPTVKKQSFRMQYSLRTFLILMVVLGVGLGWLGMIAREAERQRNVVAELAYPPSEIGFYVGEQSIWIPGLFDTSYLERIDSANPGIYPLTQGDAWRLASPSLAAGLICFSLTG